MTSGRSPEDAMPNDVPMTADAQGEKTEDEVELDVARFGERLGRYQLLLPLAQGGMGVVFAGRLVGSHGLERLVAIKTLRPITSASHRAALLREARLTSRLHHRNVVATLDLDEVGDVPYVVMELVDGVSLSKLLARLGENGERLAPELAAWIAMQCGFGLHAAHELSDAEGRSLGLVHRDVSPQNILLATTGEVKIADFGIAKFVGRDESTATGTIKGKFGYMSPEQGESDDVDRRSDVFSLGIVLWEALTGERLFATENPARTLLRVREHQPRSPAELRPDVGDELAAVTLRCLAKDREQRYATAADTADALRAALRSRGAPVDESDLAALVRRLFGTERAEFMSRLRSSAALAGSRRAPAASRSRWSRVVHRAPTFVGILGALGLSALSLWAARRVAPSEPTAHAGTSAIQGAAAPPLPSGLPPRSESVRDPGAESDASRGSGLPSHPQASAAAAVPAGGGHAHSPRASGSVPAPRVKTAPSASAPPRPVPAGSPFETL